MTTPITEEMLFEIDALLSGRFFSTGALFEDVSAGNTKKVLLANASESGVDFLTLIATRSSAKILVNKRFNVDIDTEGAALDIVNKHSGASDTSSGSAQSGGDGETGAFSSGQAFSTKTLGRSGTPADASPGETSSAGVTNVVSPGDNMVLEITNDTSSSEDISIDIDFIEVSR